MKKIPLLFCLIISALSLMLSPIQAEETYVKVDLKSAVTSASPGQTLWLGLEVKHLKDWHTYWINPGDSGYPITVKWDNPKGYEAKEIHWPVPELIVTPPLASYAYKDTIILPIPLQVPETARIGSVAKLRAKADWLMCKEICLPGSDIVTLDLPITEYSGKPSAYVDAISESLASVPAVHDHTASVFYGEKNITLTINELPKDLKNIHFFPLEEGVIKDSAEQTYHQKNNTLTISAPRDAYSSFAKDPLKGVLRYENAERKKAGLHISFDKVLTKPEISAGLAIKDITSLFNKELLVTIFLAILGGLILNLMPCVLPVLSLKILDVVKHAGSTNAWKHGLLYTFGILASFWLLAVTVVILKHTGMQVGWGFQLQSPTFIMVISALLVLVALDLLGVFEIGSSLTRLANIGHTSPGKMHSFLTGVLAAVVATPCTAPFMGAALAYTIGQPALIIIIVFSALGFGLALPYLILTANPKWTKKLPKPGPWMLTLRQILAWPILATIIWLMWVLGSQLGLMGVISLLITMLFIAFAGWMYGHLAQSGRRKIYAIIAALIFMGSLALGVYSLRVLSEQPVTQQTTTAKNEQGKAVHVDFSPEKLSQLRQDEKAVLIIFTANWCITCKVNERLVWETDEIQQYLAQKDITVMVADWTSRNDDITQELAKHGRNGIPFYVLYPAGKNSKPIYLPELVTKDIVKNALADL